MTPQLRQWGALLLVVAMAFAVYAPALGNGFVWDDRLILDKQLALFDGPAAVFFPPHLPQASPFYYRPFVTLSYLIEQRAGGGAALPFHMTPIVLHALASGLLFLLALRLLGAGALAAATLAALAFAVHPVHAEVVAWMAGRAESLAAVGALAALLAWGRWLETARWPWLAAGAGALLAGLLGKETALGIVPLAATLPQVWPAARGRLSRPWPLWGAIGVAMLTYLALRAAALGPVAGYARALPPAHGVAELLGALGFYAAGLFWPRAAGAVWTVAPTDALNVRLGAAALVFGTGAFVAALRARAAVAAWSLAWIGITLVPPLMLVLRSISATPVADRYLYLPSAGAALLLGWGLARLPARRARPVLAAVGLACVAAGIVTARRTPIWRDDLAFWRNAITAVPEEGFAHSKLGLVLYYRGDLAGAEAEYREAVAQRLDRLQQAVTQNNLGHLFLRQRRFAEAEPLFRSAIEPGPLFAGPYRGLAESVWARTAAAGAPPPAEVRALLETAVRLEPADARSALLLGQAWLTEGNRAEAARWFTRSTQAAPGSASAAQARAALAALEGH